VIPPKWASDLIDEVFSDEPPPIVSWARRSSFPSSGHANADALHVRAGTDRKDARVVLLHECAHVLRMRRNPSAAHDQEFWLIAMVLFRTFRGNVTMKYIFDREGGYRSGALAAARKLGIRGATMAAHRAPAVDLCECKALGTGPACAVYVVRYKRKICIWCQAGDHEATHV
jgi:hypothetical protein